MHNKIQKLFKVLVLSTIMTFSTMMISCEDNSGTSSNCDPNCQSVQCNGTTQAGARCQNRTTNCCGYCYLHK
jgi:hypothetical protein